MLVFYAVLILLGWLSYAYFERPVQSLIRNKTKASRTAFSPS
jgi:peptidoglycan/LPS O-acetylase OafA/YrhL